MMDAMKILLDTTQLGHDGCDLQQRVHDCHAMMAAMRNQLNATQQQEFHDGRDRERMHDYHVMMAVIWNQPNTT